MIQDANYNLVGLVGDDGALLHQYTWDPYGEPVAIERYDTGTGGTPQPFENRIGHQGLFFDRFDGGASNVLLPQLYVHPATGLAAKGLYQNRNRSYSPGLGRFVQRDPNATSLFALTIEGRSGSGGFGRVMAANVREMFHDGMSVYGYVRSEPVRGADPSGLFGFVGGLMTGMDMADMSIDAMDEALSGVQQFVGVFSKIQDYLYDQEMDGLWADDWSRPDRAYSVGAYAGLEEDAGASAGGPIYAKRMNTPGAGAARAKGTQEHHNATRDGVFGETFQRMFENAGLSIEGDYNKMRVPRGGRHPREYHEWVKNRLTRATEGLTDSKARGKAIKSALKELEADIRKDTSILYNTTKGKQTGWKGKRTKIRR